MSRAVVLDTGVWIEMGRSEIAAQAILTHNWRLRLSAVVHSELIRGARSLPERRFVGSLARSFTSVVPSIAHWIKCGEILARLGEDQHFDGRGMQLIQNDVLIALTARDLGVPVVTTNGADFARIEKHARGLSVIPFPA